jgi:predicted nucleic acid-binding protein
VKIFFDTDVLLDVLTERPPHAAASARVLSRVEQDQAEGLIAAHAVTTIHYLLARHLDRRKATAVIATLLDLVSVAPVTEKTLRHALALKWPDFEDAVTATCAVEAGASYLITRNKRDFKSLPVKVVTPEEFLSQA